MSIPELPAAAVHMLAKARDCIRYEDIGPSYVYVIDSDAVVAIENAITILAEHLGIDLKEKR